MSDEGRIDGPAARHVDTSHPSFRGMSESALLRFRSHLAGELRPTAARAASTVILVRDGVAGIEVLLLRRAGSMSFAPGMYVFPGGVVDTVDTTGSIGWGGPTSVEWAARLDTSEVDARALVTAAVRETFEESGVLLAGTSDSHLAVPDDSWRWHRAAIEDRSTSLSEFLRRFGLTLRSDLLQPWSRWVTPMWSPRRFDTMFLVARLPEHQRVESINGEFDRLVWLAPSVALQLHRAGSLPMMLPTASTLAELASVDALDEHGYDDTVRIVRPLRDDLTLRLVIDSRRGPISKDRYLTASLGA